MKLGHVSWVATLITFAAIGIIGSRFLFVTDENRTKSNDRLDTVPVQGAEQITTYFIFDNDDPNDAMRGSQFYGGQHKLGVRKIVLTNLPNRNADFLTIANKPESRQQFLQANGKTLDLQGDRWQIRVIDSGMVSGEIRVAVLAMLGHDEPRMNGAIGPQPSHVVCEIWRLNTAGEAPTLLDRSLMPQVGLSTTAEVPPPPLPVLPAGIVQILTDPPPGSTSAGP